MAVSGILAGALSALGGVAGAVGKGGHGPGSSGALGQKAGGPAPYVPTAGNFGPGAGGATPGADLRLSEILGQQPRRPEDEMTLGMMLGGYS